MTAPTVKLGFFKLNVPDMDAALRFYEQAFGFAVVQSFDEQEFVEHIMALPGQEAGPNLLLVAYKDGRDVTPGKGHGPVGLITQDIDEQVARALAAGATVTVPIFEMPGVKVSMLRAPEGHELEIIQLT